MQVVPYSEVLTAVDTGLRTDSPPDLFRVSYTDVAAYRGQKVLANLSDADTLKDSFLPAFWAPSPTARARSASRTTPTPRWSC